MTAALPFFPLGTVLLPGEIQPLHVFEERYRALVRDVRAADGRFGVALIERGSEVGGGDVRSDVGTVARIEHAEEYPDGRWGLVVMGTERVRVVRWERDEPYPRAVVEPFEDVPEDPGSIGADRARLRARLGHVLALASEAGLRVPPLPPDVDGVDEGVWALAAVVPIGPFDRQRLLAADSVGLRCARIDDALTDLEVVLRHRLTGGEEA